MKNALARQEDKVIKDWVTLTVLFILGASLGHTARYVGDERLISADATDIKLAAALWKGVSGAFSLKRIG